MGGAGMYLTLEAMARFTQFAVASAKMLLQDAGFEVTEANAYDVAVILGVGLVACTPWRRTTPSCWKPGPTKFRPL